MQKQKPDQENNVGASARHNARRYALQAMYQWVLADNAIADIEVEFLTSHITKKTDRTYFKDLINGVATHQVELDQTMLPFLTRSLTEIDPIELSILRLAIYELLKRPDVPYRVIINEALELTKKFGSIEGYKFVNSLLDRIAKKTRETEINLAKMQRPHE